MQLARLRRLRADLIEPTTGVPEPARRPPSSPPLVCSRRDDPPPTDFVVTISHDSVAARLPLLPERRRRLRKCNFFFLGVPAAS